MGTGTLLRDPAAAAYRVEILPDGTAALVEEEPVDYDSLIPVSEKPILADVRAYRIGATLGIPELMRFAFRRLWEYEWTLENHLHILEYVYFGTPQTKRKEDKEDKGKAKDKVCGLADPDLKLRWWCRGWLKSKEKQNGGRTNLEVIKDPMHYGMQFLALRNKGGLLLADTDAAEAESRNEDAKEQKEKDTTSSKHKVQFRELDRPREAPAIGWLQNEKEEYVVREGEYSKKGRRTHLQVRT